MVTALLSSLMLALQVQAWNGVPSKLSAKLTRGVNITRWFGYVPPHDTNLFQNYLVVDDFANFKKLGVRFVRLCVSPEVIYRDGEVDSTNLPYLDAGLGRLESAGLAVLWDLHDNGQLKLDSPGHDNSGFVRFWESMARHYKGKQEDSMVFELLNEPIFQKNPDVWYDLQARTVRAVRAIDPARTILVASTSWNGIDTLAAMNPLPERNLIYSFHCYDPFVFTHQGATWTGDQQKALKDVPFPSSPEAVAAMIGEIPAQFQGAVRDYGEHRYDASYVHGRLQKAFDWGARNHVPVLLGEFGSYPPVAPVDSRARWFDAMRGAIREFGLPNSVWGYDDGLGLGRSRSADGSVHLDPVTLEHLYGQRG